MARHGDSPAGAGQAGGLALGALHDLARRRSGVDHPGLYPNDDNPWTDQLARRLRDLVAEELARAPDRDRRHVLAARWRAAALLEDGPVAAARNPVYDIAWRVYSADCARLEDQPLIVECPWRGGWRACAPACDRLAQARAGLRVLCAQADPDAPVGEMGLKEACAFRIAAFAPAGEPVLLAFYGGAQSWRGEAGFSIYAYTTGRRGVSPAP